MSSAPFGLNQEHGLRLRDTINDLLDERDQFKEHAERLAEALAVVANSGWLVELPDKSQAIVREALAAWEGAQQKYMKGGAGVVKKGTDGIWRPIRQSNPENESDDLRDDGRSDGYGESYAERQV